MRPPKPRNRKEKRNQLGLLVGDPSLSLAIAGFFPSTVGESPALQTLPPLPLLTPHSVSPVTQYWDPFVMVRLLHASCLVLCVSSLCVCVLAFPVLCCLVFEGEMCSWVVLVWVLSSGRSQSGVFVSFRGVIRFVELLGSWSY